MSIRRRLRNVIRGVGLFMSGFSGLFAAQTFNTVFLNDKFLDYIDRKYGRASDKMKNSNEDEDTHGRGKQPRAAG